MSTNPVYAASRRRENRTPRGHFLLAYSKGQGYHRDMRSKTTISKIEQLMAILGKEAKTPGTIYLVGGASAVLMGWREMTLDVDLKLEPEPAGVFAGIRDAKESLDINIELAAPDDFIPPLPGWRDRSQFIARVGKVDFRHYDFYSQALAKIERGHRQDIVDVEAMFTRRLIDAIELRKLFTAIESSLIRYPGIDAEEFHRKVEQVLVAHKN